MNRPERNIGFPPCCMAPARYWLVSLACAEVRLPRGLRHAFRTMPTATVGVNSQKSGSAKPPTLQRARHRHECDRRCDSGLARPHIDMPPARGGPSKSEQLEEFGVEPEWYRVRT